MLNVCIPEFWSYRIDSSTFSGNTVYIHIIIRVQNEVPKGISLHCARILKHKLLIIWGINHICQGHLRKKSNEKGIITQTFNDYTFLLGGRMQLITIFN